MRARGAGFVVVVAALLACAPVGEAQTRRDDATVVGERDGWTELVLRDGKRALVPSDDEPAPKAKPKPKPRTAPATPKPKASPTPVPSPTTTPPPALSELRTEIERLRALVDEMETHASRAPAAPEADPTPPPRSWLESESLTMLGLALVAGILIGAAVQRQRARRSRSLRF